MTRRLWIRTKLLVPSLLGLAIVASLALAACGGDEKAAVRRSVDGILLAINRGEPEVIYDRYAPSGCRTVPGRDAFIINFNAARYEVDGLRLDNDNIQIDGDLAYMIITADFTQQDGSSEQRTFLETLVKEAGRWKDEDCFLGGLGNVADAPTGLPGIPTPTTTSPLGTPTGTVEPGAGTPETPTPDATAPAGTTSAATPTPAPGGA